jgi:hypothetical protein
MLTKIKRLNEPLFQTLPLGKTIESKNEALVMKMNALHQ